MSRTGDSKPSKHRSCTLAHCWIFLGLGNGTGAVSNAIEGSTCSTFDSVSLGSWLSTSMWILTRSGQFEPGGELAKLCGRSVNLRL